MRNKATCELKIEHVSKDLDSASCLMTTFFSAVAHNFYWNYYRGVPGQGRFIWISFRMACAHIDSFEVDFAACLGPSYCSVDECNFSRLFEFYWFS